MGVRVYAWKGGGWEYDIRGRFDDGNRYRERRRSHLTSKSGTRDWALAREREILAEHANPPKELREAPRLAVFAPVYLETARANRQKPSTVATKESLLRVHLLPLLGEKRLDALTNADVARLKAAMRELNAKTVNTALTCLSTLLKCALELGELERMPCSIALLPVEENEADFFDFDEYTRLLFHCVGPKESLIVLLGGDAGLRLGEMLALRWEDVSFPRRELHVCRSIWRGSEGTTKGRRARRIPTTSRLHAALREGRKLGSEAVLPGETKRSMQRLVERVARRAGLEGGVHKLRHTFISHLAMHGAPARAIMELAGHRNLKVTQRYMHLSPAAVESAIKLLESPPVSHTETGT